MVTNHIVPLFFLDVEIDKVKSVSASSPASTAGSKKVEIFEAAKNFSWSIKASKSKQTMIQFTKNENSSTFSDPDLFSRPVVNTENKQDLDSETLAAETDSLNLSNSNDIGSFYTVARSLSDEQKLKALEGIWKPEKNYSFPVKIICKKKNFPSLGLISSPGLLIQRY